MIEYISISILGISFITFLYVIFSKGFKEYERRSELSPQKNVKSPLIEKNLNIKGHLNPSISNESILPIISFEAGKKLVPKGGALEIDSPLYISRTTDQEVEINMRPPRGMVIVRGARQSGKTSMLLRICDSLEKTTTSYSVVYFDFQQWGDKTRFHSIGELWKNIADEIASSLEIDTWDASLWNSNRQPHINFTRFLKEYVLQDKNKQLFLCIDEVDTLFNYPIKESFFSNVRGFYNQGASDPTWKRVSWLLGISSEPRSFIEDLNQSPFNIGLNLQLTNFGEREIEEFAKRFEISLKSQEVLDILKYVGGRPFLVHLTLHHIAQHSTSVAKIFEGSISDGGIFKEHLEHYLRQIQTNKELTQAMKQALEGEEYPDIKLAGQLESLGLVLKDEKDKLIPSCELYREYFTKKLK